MTKTLTLLFFTLATITCYAQQTPKPITGIDAIKLGDSITRINAYGFPFIGVTKYHVGDTSRNATKLKKILTKEEAEEVAKVVSFSTSDSGRTFCPDVAVFITKNFTISQIPHSKIATLALTYYKNVLIEIRIIDSAKRIRDNYSYGISRYGKNFGKTFNEVKGYLETRENATHPSWKVKEPKVDISKTAITTIAKQLDEDKFLESIFWQNGGYSFAYNYCSAPRNFWANKNTPSSEQNHDWGCAEGAIIIKNEKAYKAMIACSEETLKLSVIK